MVDAVAENSPVSCAMEYAARYANHSSQPNARMETWPVLNAGPFELRQHMMIVATEPIDAGAEGELCGDWLWPLPTCPPPVAWMAQRLKPHALPIAAFHSTRAIGDTAIFLSSVISLSCRESCQTLECAHGMHGHMHP